MKYFIDNIIWLKKRNGFTQEDLAERLNISRQSISKWERGEALPDIENLIELSKLYGVTIDELINSDLRDGASDSIEEEITDEEHDSITIKTNENEVVLDKDMITVKTKNGDDIVVKGKFAAYFNDKIMNPDSNAKHMFINAIYKIQCFFIIKTEFVDNEEYKKDNNIMFSQNKYVDGVEYTLYGLNNIFLISNWICWDKLKENYIKIYGKKNLIKIYADNNVEFDSKNKVRKATLRRMTKLFRKVYKDGKDYRNHISYNG